MIELLFIIASSLLYRARGIKSFMIWPFAALIAAYTTETNSAAVAIALSIVAGEAPGWSNPLSSYLKQTKMPINDSHWWQFNRKLKENTLLSLAFRGLMFATPPALAALYFGIEAMPFLFIGIAFVASPIIIVKATERKRPKSNYYNYEVFNRKFAEKIWGYQEFIVGALIGLGFVLGLS